VIYKNKKKKKNRKNNGIKKIKIKKMKKLKKNQKNRKGLNIKKTFRAIKKINQMYRQQLIKKLKSQLSLNKNIYQKKKILMLMRLSQNNKIFQRKVRINLKIIKLLNKKLTSNLKCKKASLNEKK